ncbi:MAG: bifunctional nuclease family protein [Bacteroidales bacterium]|nr:bifunctional nuclease family protein [Bacteroidales bacterium]MBD5247203.1 bifunctional nuclease family protein [Barnesiella sp.]MBD5258341.1 bifunctional nuclease family protein [Barnesiella sp.]
MKEKIKLKVVGLTYSQIQSGAYALILGEIDGPYRIPVVIGAPEAQSIAIELEGIIPPRPLTHDLFESFTHAFGIKLLEVYIYKFEDGIFYSELTFSDGERQIVLDSRTSDAIAIAIRTKSPIYTTSEILTTTGFVLENDDNTSLRADHDADDGVNAEPRLENYALEELEALLAKHIDNEEYEQAAEVQAIINRKRDSQNNNH